MAQSEPQMSLREKLQKRQQEQLARERQNPSMQPSSATAADYHLRPAKDAPTKFDITAYKGYLRENEDDLRGLVQEFSAFRKQLFPDLLCDVYNKYHGDHAPVDAFKGNPITVVKKYFDMAMRQRLCGAVDFTSSLGGTNADILGCMTCEDDIRKTLRQDAQWLDKLYSTTK